MSSRALCQWSVGAPVYPVLDACVVTVVVVLMSQEKERGCVCLHDEASILLSGVSRRPRHSRWVADILCRHWVRHFFKARLLFNLFVAYSGLQLGFQPSRGSLYIQRAWGHLRQVHMLPHFNRNRFLQPYLSIQHLNFAFLC